MPVAEHSALVVGLDIGATKTIAGLVTKGGDLLRSLQVATPPSPPAILDAARTLCESLIAQAGAPVLAIGVGCAGVVDTRRARVIHANDNLPGWGGTNLRALSMGGLPLVAENDVRAMAFGEATLGGGHGFDSLLCVTVGTGIGGALIVKGEIWPGANFSAGEIGYLVVGWTGDQPQILDQYASGPAIERAWQAAAGAEERLPLREISARAYAGDATARKVIRRKAREFGVILAGYATSINPQAVIVGGGVAQIGQLWWDAFATAFRANLPPLLASTRLLPAALGVEAVLLGAALLAWREVEP